MAPSDLQRIRNAIFDRRYALTEHARDEMAEEALDVLDLELAIFACHHHEVAIKDQRRAQFVVIDAGTDQRSPVGVVLRIVEFDQVLVVSVYTIV